MDARIQARMAGEEDVIGPFVYGRGREYMEQASINKDMLESRRKFIEFCQINTT